MGIQLMFIFFVFQVKMKEEVLEEDDYDCVCGEFMSLLWDFFLLCEYLESGEDLLCVQLLKQFEQEVLIEGGLEFNFYLLEYVKFRVEGVQENKNDVNIFCVGDQFDLFMVVGNVIDVIDNVGQFGSFIWGLL